MNRQDESRLRSNKFTLQKRLQFEDGVMLAYMLQEEVFSEGTMHDIESKPTRSAKASALLSTLPRCGPTAFKVFVEALDESGQKHLVELLGPPQTLPPQNEQSPVKTPTEVSSEPKENVASGESNKEQASASKMTEQPSTMSPEEIKQSTYFKDCTSSFIDIKLECLPKKISEDPKAKVIKTGHALVICNDKLMKTESRVGSAYDNTNIDVLFRQKLGFQVVAKRNLTVQEMKAAVEAERKCCNDIDGIDGFLLCIMSVGGCGRIRGVDGETISIDELTTCFDDVNCPALKGKPKIVIIETCQEGNEKCPSEPQSSAPGVDELEGALKDVHISKPKPSNMIEVRCAIKGYQTARSETYGSWFIRTLITNISEHAHQDDVVSLMKGVRLKWTNIDEKKIEITVSSAEESKVYFHPQCQESNRGSLSHAMAIA